MAQRLEINSLKHNVCNDNRSYQRQQLHYHVRTLLMLSHLLVLLNFFSHFVLYSHSCQWSVGTVKHVQSPSAFTTSPASSKMPVLISKNLWALKMVPLQSIPCKHLTLTQHFLKLLQTAGSNTSKKNLINWLGLCITYIYLHLLQSNNAQINRSINEHFMCTLLTRSIWPRFTQSRTLAGILNL